MVAVHGEETMPVQILKAPAKAGARETATVAFVAQKVPQMGLKLYRLVADTRQRQSGGFIPAGGIETAALSGKRIPPRRD